ncbi:type II toxin-antitoxin system VapC family toxin [Candidatus Thiothrix sp. Deng01]|uniref:Type II toxin-antitoxin system VapC family toxin n=1 Tax=Candidatus Thiothrix phosphatis TaxID=3112415 RepID=A0ABU6CUT9_9GAMM|nr:type II toxin-antitoxin system VapC family toxin [Candidatus Thiothrix sp. Deng01]MEB4590282.1 type II toxin-antitoxin system VapC family toxin [Candidatus Thiothrix sp. Deng01]
MSLVYLLDTNVLSEPTKLKPDEQVMHKLQQHYKSIATASIVWHELLFGCQRLPLSHKRSQLEHYFQDLLYSGLPVLAYTQAAAIWHAEERTRLTNMGKTPAFVDGMIAAIAHSHGLTLVTRNISDFEYFSDLRLENWFSS